VLIPSNVVDSRVGDVEIDVWLGFAMAGHDKNSAEGATGVTCDTPRDDSDINATVHATHRCERYDE
jgi:hypothetical protein